MSALSRKSKGKKSILIFMLIIALLVGGMNSFTIPSFAGDKSYKVTYKVSDKEDEYEVQNEGGKSVDLPDKAIPGDPVGGGNQEFSGWKQTAPSKDSSEKLWKKEDLKKFKVSDDTEFQAVFTEIDKGDSKNGTSSENENPKSDDDKDTKNDDSKSKNKRDGISTQSMDIELEWNGTTSLSQTIEENQSEVLNVKIPAQSGFTGTKRELVIKFGHKNTPQFTTNTTDSGFSLANYTAKAELSDVIKDASFDPNTNTLKYELEDSYANTTLKLTFKANQSKVYLDEKLDIKAEFKEDSSLISSGQAEAKAELINRGLRTELYPIAPAQIKSGQGSGTAQLKLTISNVTATYKGEVDFNDVWIRINGVDKTYGEWLDEPIPPFKIFKNGGGELTANTHNGKNTILEIGSTSINPSAYTRYVYFKYETTDDFKNARISINGQGAALGLKTDIKYKYSNRGPEIEATQYKTGTTPSTNVGIYPFNDPKVYLSVDKDLEPNLVSIRYIQPNSVAYKDDPDLGYLYESFMFSFYCLSTRTAEDAENAEDQFTFTVPAGMEITQILLPESNAEYDSVEIQGVNETFAKGKKISLENTPLTGDINMTISGLQYIKKNDASTGSLIDNTKIRFIGKTSNMNTSSSRIKVVETNDTTNQYTIGVSFAPDGKMIADPNINVSNDFILNNSFTDLGGTVKKGESFYVQANISGGSYPYSSAYYEKQLVQRPIFPGPVLYFDVPGGIEVDDAVLSGITTGYNGQNIKAVVSQKFPNEGKWASTGGQIVEVKLVDASDPSKEAILNRYESLTTQVRLKLTVPEDYDESQFGDSFTYDNKDMKLNSYSDRVSGLGTNGSLGNVMNYTLPAGAAAKVAGRVIVDYNATPITKNVKITMPSTAKVDGAVRIGDGQYRIYNSAKPETLPERPAGSKNEEFKMYMGYGYDNSVDDARAYFILPQGNGWSPTLNKQPTVNMTGLTDSEVKYYYTKDDMTGVDKTSLGSTGDISKTWIEFKPGTTPISNADLPNVTAFKCEFEKVDNGDTFNMYMPFELPPVGGAVQYDQIIEGKSLYFFDTNTKDEGGKPALKLVKSDKPMVRQAQGANADIAIPSAQVNVDFGDSSAIPKWYETITYDDYTANVKLDKIVIKYTEQGKTNAVTTTLSAADFDTPVSYTPTDQGIKTFKDGYKTTVKTAQQSIVDAKKPGLYEISYISTVDEDTQVGTASRKIFVEKTASNSLKTTPAEFEMSYTDGAGDHGYPSGTWDQVFRSKLDVSDIGLTPNKVDANAANSGVVLEKATTAENQNTNLGTNATALTKIANTPGKYILTYKYTDKYGKFVPVYLNLYTKYKGDLETQVKMGATGVSGASIENDFSSTKNTNASGSTSFSYSATKATPEAVSYQVELKTLPNGYKMPGSGLTKAGSINKDNNSGTNNVIEVFNVSPVSIKAVLTDNNTEQYMNSVSLYKKGSSDTLVTTVAITNQASYTFLPETGKVFDGEYYIVANIKPGYELDSSGDFTLTGGKNTANTGSTANVDITKTLKIKKSKYKVNYYGVNDYNNPVTTYAITFKDNVVNGSRPVPSPTERNDSHFIGWYDAKTGGNIIAPDGLTMGAVNINLYEKHAPNKYDVVFKAGSNGSFKDVQEGTVTLGGITHGSIWSTVTSGKIPEPDAGNGYYFSGWSPTLPANSDAITKTGIYTANYSAKPVVTFSAIDAGSTVYNGEEQATSVGVTMEGNLLSGHSYNDNLKASARGEDAGTYTTTITAAATSNFTGLPSGKSPQDYYIINYVGSDFKITKKDVTVKPVDIKREYKPSTPLKATHATESGIVPGQTLAIDSTAYKGLQLDVGISDSSIDTNDVKIMKGSSDKAFNYNITTNKGKIEVTLNTTDLKVKAVNNSVKYDGKKHSIQNETALIENKPDSSAKLLYSTSKNGTYSSTKPEYTDADAYTLWVKSEKKNYKDTEPVQASIVITKRNITIKPDSVTETYNGKNHSASSYTIAGDNLAEGQKIDSKTIAYKGTRKDAGSNLTEVSGTVKLVGGYEKNYSISKKSGTMNVKKRPVGIVPVDTSKRYDGKPLKATNVKVIKGSMVNGETIVDPKFDKSITQVGRSSVRITDVNVKGGQKSNYDFSYGSGTLTVNRSTTPNIPDVQDRDNGSDDNDRRPVAPDPIIEPAGGTTDTVRNTDTITEMKKTDNGPSFRIGNTDVPLFGSNSFPSWAFINLILTIAGILLMVIIIIPIWQRKKEEDRLEDQGYERNKSFNPKWFIVGSIFAIAQILVFIFTQNLRGTMVLMDMWTIAHGLGTALIIVSLILTLKVDEHDDYQVN